MYDPLFITYFRILVLWRCNVNGPTSFLILKIALESASTLIDNNC